MLPDEATIGWCDDGLIDVEDDCIRIDPLGRTAQNRDADAGLMPEGGKFGEQGTGRGELMLLVNQNRDVRRDTASWSSSGCWLAVDSIYRDALGDRNHPVG
jgi:hypothetical protein